MRALAILAVLGTVAVADEIPNKPVRGELAGKAFTPDHVELRLDGNREWHFLATLGNEDVKVDLPIELTPATGECIQFPLRKSAAAFTDMRSGTNVWSANVEFTLRFDEVTADHAKGGITAKFSPVPGIGGENGWFAGQFDAPINRVLDFGTERACTKAENHPIKTPFAGVIKKSNVSEKNWELVEIPDSMRRPQHWRLRVPKGFGDVGIDLDGTPAVGCTTRTIKGRRMESFVGLDPVTYVVAFDSITADKASGWVRYDWEDETTSGAGRFEAKVVHATAVASTHLCK